jgi:hypothetical protein
MRKSKQSADFEWDVDANIKARGTVGAAPPKAAPKRIITQAKPVRSRRRDWIWHYCQKWRVDTTGRYRCADVFKVRGA